MKREILFRAWQDNQMITQPMSGNYALSRFIGFLYEDAQIMQFTGLTDKNGKKIFEGDIVKKIKYPYSQITVEFTDGKFNISEYIPYRIKVIGNIYDNPELL